MSEVNDPRAIDEGYSMDKYDRPSVPADNVIFTITKEQVNTKYKALPNRTLKVLLIKRKGKPYKDYWALPGGFSNKNEDLYNTAKRELQEETKIDNIYLKMLNQYSTPERDPRGWVISLAFYALVNSDFLDIEAGDDAAEAQWFDVRDIENMELLAFDHKQIILDAIEKIKNDIHITDIAKEFLPDEFSAIELYQVIKTVDSDFNEERPNFLRKIISRNIVEETSKTHTKYSQKPAKLYKFTGKVPKLSIYS
ncbi:MutT/NUDIX hydrolase [Bacillus phage G]|uniref:Gp273 n=1 Tax=Bacillus phage G TaxID=2884420 RepID=G3MA14_9CAUD|nr:MutT/NUDIX hydrolase [Bacillus phage G]AEO93532.1 gp273 [Bacillus phage G]